MPDITSGAIAGYDESNTEGLPQELEGVTIPPNILVVDDESLIRTGLGNLLQLWGYRCRCVESGLAALHAVSQEQFDVVITDIRMPEMNGLELLHALRRRDADLDVVMITAYDMDVTYMDVIEAGATDFVVKPFESDELRAKLHRIVKDRQVRHRLVNASTRDDLTHLYNHRAFRERLDNEITRAVRQHHELSLLMIDIDGLKQINDSHGHDEGDALLVAFGATLNGSLRHRVDTAYRIGGDEFAAILIETDLESAEIVAQRVLTSWNASWKLEGSISIGVATLLEDETASGLIGRADAALYRAKHAGGARTAAAGSNA